MTPPWRRGLYFPLWQGCSHRWVAGPGPTLDQRVEERFEGFECFLWWHKLTRTGVQVTIVLKKSTLSPAAVQEIVGKEKKKIQKLIFISGNLTQLPGQQVSLFEYSFLEQKYKKRIKAAFLK